MKILSPTASVDEILQRVSHAATEEVNSLRVDKQKDKHLTIIFAGYRYTDSGVESGACQISNFEHMSGSSRLFGPFEVEVAVPSDGVYAAVVGFEHKELYSPMSDLIQLAGAGAPGSALEGKSVQIIRDFTGSPSSKGLVGPTCTTSWLNVDPAEPVLGGHHAADGSGRIVMHDMVVM